jgi:hypothetical protein
LRRHYERTAGSHRLAPRRVLVFVRIVEKKYRSGNSFIYIGPAGIALYIQ